MPTIKQVSPQKIIESVLRILIYFGIIWYIFECLVNYFHQRPLWNDEYVVFLSIESFNTQQMFGQRLLAIQVFPRLYLFLIQKFSGLFHYSLLSLRFFSFLCMMSGFFIWLKLAKYEFKSKLEYLTFVLSWTASAMLIYYSSELKQYSMDVMVGGLYLLFIYNQEYLKKMLNRGKYIILLIGLAILCLFSYMAFLFSAIVLYNFIVSKLKGKDKANDVLLFGFFILVAAGWTYIFDMRHVALDTYTDSLLKDYFISLESAGAFLKSFGEGVNNLFSRWLVEHPRIIKKIGIFFMTFGLLNIIYSFFSKIKKDKFELRTINTIAFVLFLELIILGVFKKYPFTVPRTSLFFCPIVLLMTIKGLRAIKKIHIGAYILVFGLYIIYLLFLSGRLSYFAYIGQSIFHPII